MLDLSLSTYTQLRAKDDRSKFLGYCSMFKTTYALSKDKWLPSTIGLEERGSAAGC